MTHVFFFFALHQSAGILAMLLCIPATAGRSFFKLCSATAAFLMTASLWLVYRRYGILGGPLGPLAFQSAIGCLALTVLYNRAEHFSWQPLLRPLQALALAAGLLATLLADAGPLMAACDLASILLLGAATTAMILGHYYLVVLDLPISALRRLTALLVAGLVARTLVVGLAILGPWHVGFDALREVAFGLWNPDGVFIWMRLLFGLVGPLSLIWFIWKTVEIRSTQSATGILYVQLFLVLSGELLAKYLRVAAGLAL